jgi:short subunit dehydrogenase-like uncharacterized protein
LAQNYKDGSIKWAIAGRSPARLKETLLELEAELGCKLDSVDILTVDTSVPAALPTLVSQTRTVATTVGPYALYGSSVVEFCAKFGTHYVDITGEVGWVQAMIQQWQTTAKKTGSILISFCGHDSVPWDLSVMKMQKMLKKECNDTLTSVSFLDQAVGGAGGGTIATILSGIEGDAVHSAPHVDHFRLNANGVVSQSSFRSNLPLWIHRARSPWDSDRKRWTMPFIMAFVNAKVIRWSHSLRDDGTELTYFEAMVFPDFKTAWTSYLAFIMFATSFLNPVSLYLVRKALPKPGQGPPLQDMEKKHYLGVFGEGVGIKGNRVESVMYFSKDAGCLETSKMLVESGLCLALQQNELPCTNGGFWTPSTALGDVLLRRLQNVGITFDAQVVRNSEEKS